MNEITYNKTMNATKRQTWAIFCMSGYDVRPCKLNIEQASKIISELKNGGNYGFSQLTGAILKKKINSNNKKAKNNRQKKLQIEKRYWNEKTRFKTRFPEGGSLGWDDEGCSYNSGEGLASISWTITDEYWKFYGARASGSGKRNWNKMKKFVIGGMKNGTIINRDEFFKVLHEHEIDYWCIN